MQGPNQTENESDLSVFYYGPFKDAGGYAKMNREICTALLKNNVNVYISMMKSGQKCKEVDVDYLKNKSFIRNKKDTFYINGSLPQYPPNKEFKTNLVFTMMETETLHPTFVEKCNLYDHIIVPCEWNVRVFKECGVKRPIIKVPLGVNTDLYNPLAQPCQYPFGNNKFVFFSLFGWSMRKGCDILIRSFIRAFGENDDVVLVVMSRLWGSEDPARNKQIHEEINRYAKLEGYNKTPKNIIHIGKGYEEKDLPAFFTAAQCFVGSSRGEGFFLPAIEAGACEIPVIATRHGGQLEFLDDETSYFIEPEGIEPCKNLKLDTISTYYGANTQICKLSGPAIEKLAERMTYVINNYNEAKNKAKKLRSKIVNNFTWDHSARSLICQIKKI